MTPTTTAPKPTSLKRAREHFEIAVRHHQRDELREAEAAYRRAIEHDPHLPEAHNNLGVALRARGEDDAALEAFRTAVALRSTYTEALNNVALALAARGEHGAAIEQLRAALGSLGAAITPPVRAQLHATLGASLRAVGEHEAAIESLETAVRLLPTLAQAHFDLGNVLLDLGRNVEAGACYERALALQPDWPEALNNLGGARRNLGEFGESIELYRRALELRPDFPEAVNNLGLTLRDARLPQESEVVLREGLARYPGSSAMTANLAAVLQDLGKIEDARSLAQKALEIDGELCDAWNVLANCAADECDFHEALRLYERAIAANPHQPHAAWNRSLSLLALGDYARGFAAYEKRWDMPTFRADARQFAQPVWDGSSLDGRTILLYGEQGLGDVIQFARFAKVLKERFDTTIVIECSGALVPLFRQCAWADRVIGRGETLPPFDVQAALLSLPYILGTTLDTLPSQVPYITAEPRDVERLVERDGALNVGIVWAGRNDTPRLASRTIGLAALETLADIPGVRLHSLQKGPAVTELAASAYRDRIVDLGAAIGDFADTAAAINALDLVVTVDTAVAHLAGALGKPVWILLIEPPDWRWLRNRSDSPWYPTARLFRQRKPGDWPTVVRDVRDAMRERAGVTTTRLTGAELPAAHTGKDGEPRYRLTVPYELLADERCFTVFQRELAEGGADVEPRIFVDEQLRTGDVYVDVGAGLGLAALSAATVPGRRVHVIAVAPGHEAELLRANAAQNVLTGRIEVVTGVPDGQPAVDRIVAEHARDASRVFVRVADAGELPAVLAGAAELIASGRLLAVIWPCRADAQRAEPVLADAIPLAGLSAFGYSHFRLVVRDGEPQLDPLGAVTESVIVFSLSRSYLASESGAQTDASTAALTANGATATVPEGTSRSATPEQADLAQRIGIDWQLCASSGWGVYGLNLALRCLRNGGPFPVLLTPPDLRGVSEETRQLLEPAVAAHWEIAAVANRHRGCTIRTGFTMLRSLGNGLMGASSSFDVSGKHDVAVIFFEDTTLTPQALARARRFERVVAGSTWNAEVLRGYGLEHVCVSLQGVDTSAFRPGPRTGVFGDRFVVFSGGKLEYRKGQDIVVAAFREFHRRHPDSLLVVAWHNHWPRTMAEVPLRGHVSGVPEVDGSGRADIGGWLVRNGVPQGAFVDLGLVPNTQMGRLMREAHVGLFTNRCEGGTNLVAMECMASGVPTILSANTGHLDLIADGQCYALREQGPALPSRQFAGVDGWGESSVDEVLAMLEHVYTHRDEAARVGEGGAVAMQRLSWDNQIDHLLRTIGDLL